MIAEENQKSGKGGLHPFPLPDVFYSLVYCSRIDVSIYDSGRHVDKIHASFSDEHSYIVSASLIGCSKATDQSGLL